MSAGGRIDGHAASYQGGPVLTVKIIVSDAGLSVSGDIHDWRWTVAALENAADSVKRQGLAKERSIMVPALDTSMPSRMIA